MFVSSVAKYTNWTGSATPAVRRWWTGSYFSIGPAKEGYVFFANPFTVRPNSWEPGANVTAANITFWTRTVAGTGTHTVKVRLLSAATDFAKIVWSNRPGVGTMEATVSKTGALGDYTRWQIDVTSIVQWCADNGRMPGFRFTSPDTNMNIAGMLDNETRKPKLNVSYLMSPLAPDGLLPNAGGVISTATPTLRWAFFDHVGENEIDAAQVQLSTTSSFTSPAYDSGAVDVTAPQMALNSPLVTPGKLLYWRVRHRDSGGLWSHWSLPTSFVYQPLPTVTITNPTLDGSVGFGWVTDPTPNLDWVYTSSVGSAQTRCDARLEKLVNGKWVTVDSTRAISSTSWAPKVSMSPKFRYRLVLSTRDSFARQATPGAPAFSWVAREIVFSDVSDVVKPTGVVISDVRPVPTVEVRWSRIDTPDEWIVYRDNKILYRGSGLSLAAGGGTYKYVDKMVPNGYHVYRLHAVVNKKVSKGVYIGHTHEHEGTWLFEPTSREGLCIMNDKDHDMVMPEVGSVLEPLGSQTVVLVTEAQRGYEGTIQGNLTPLRGHSETAVQMRERAMRYKASPGYKFFLLIEDLGFEVAIQKLTVAGSAELPGSYDISFNFYQTDDFIFDDGLDGAQ